MRNLNLFTVAFIIFLSATSSAQENINCKKISLNQKTLKNSVDNLAVEAATKKDFSNKQLLAKNLLEQLNCELERTKSYSVKDKYRWQLSQYHAILTDLSMAKSCKNLENKMLYNQSTPGPDAENDLITQNKELIKKLAKSFCQSSEK